MNSRHKKTARRLKVKVERIFRKVNLRLWRTPEKKKRIKRGIGKDDVKDEIVALSLPKIMSLRPNSPKIQKRIGVRFGDLEKTSLRLSATIVIKKITTSKIVSSQKTSYCLGDLYVGDCWFGS